MPAEAINHDVLKKIKPEVLTELTVDFSELGGESNVPLARALGRLNRGLFDNEGNIRASMTADKLASYEKIMFKIQSKLDELIEKGQDSDIIAAANETLQQISEDEGGLQSVQEGETKDVPVWTVQDVNEAIIVLYEQLVDKTGDVGREKEKRAGKVPVEEVKKVEISAEFDSDAFERDLISKFGFPELGRLKRNTTEWLGTSVVLEPSYAPDTSLSSERSATTVINKIDKDLQEIESAIKRTQDATKISEIVRGFVDPQRADRENYVRLTLKNKLEALQKTLLERRKRFQNAKDSLITVPLDTIPEVKQLQEMIQRVHGEKSSASSLDQLLNLRKNLITAQGKVDLARIADEIQKKYQISAEKARQITDKIQSSELDPIQADLQDLDATILDFWTKKYLVDKSQAPEAATFVDLLNDKNTSGRTSKEDLELRRNIAKAKAQLEGKRDSYIHKLPSTLEAKAKAHIDGMIAQAKPAEDDLLNRAIGKLEGELKAHPLLKDLMEAKANATDNTVESSVREQAIADAIHNIDDNDVVSTFDTELDTKVREKLRDLKAAVEGERKKLETARLDRAKSGNESIVERRNKVITEILQVDSASKNEKNPNSFWFRDLNYLRELQQKLADEILAASQPGGVRMEQTEYEEARKAIDKFVETREKFTVERMEEIWGDMRGNFRKPSDSQTDPVYEMYKIAEKRDDIFGEDNKQRFKALEGLWKAFQEAAVKNGTTDVIKNLIWSNSDDAHHVIESYSSDLDAFLEYGKPVDGKPNGVTISDLIKKVDEIFAAGKYMTHKGVGHNYGKEGNPDASASALGAPTLQEILLHEYPDVPKSVIDAISLDQVLCTDARYPYIQKYYETWDQSPVGVQDFKPISICSALAYCTYNEIKSRNIPQGYRVSRRFFRHTSVNNFPVPPGSVELNIFDADGKPTGRKQYARKPTNAAKAHDAEENLPEVQIAINRANRERMQMDMDKPDPRNLKRVTLDDGVTPLSTLPEPEYVQLHSVEVGSDGINFPYFAHILRGTYPGKTTASEYFKAYKAYDEFRDLIEKGPTIDSAEIVGGYKNVLKKVSIFKGVFAVLRVEKSKLPGVDDMQALAKGWSVEGDYYVHPHWHVLMDEVRMKLIDYSRAAWQQINDKAVEPGLIESIRAGHPGKDIREYFLEQFFDNTTGDLPDEIRYFVKNVLHSAMIPSEIDLLQKKDYIGLLKKKAGVGEFSRPKAVEKSVNRNLFSQWTAVSGRIDMVDAMTSAHEKQLRHQYMEVNATEAEGRKDTTKH